MVSQIARRDFLIASGVSLAGAYVAYRLANNMNFGAANYDTDPHYGLPVLSRHIVPDTINPINIDKVVEAISSEASVSKGNYLPQFVDFVQYFHQKLTGATYQQHLKQTSEGRFQNSIEILAVRGIRGELNLDGQFVHENEEVKRNIALVNADVVAAQFLHLLNHELIHGMYGAGELTPNAHTHRDILYMVAQFPQLLRERDSECPLMSLMTLYIGRVKRDKDGLSLDPNPETLPYLMLLSNDLQIDGKPAGNLSIDEAVNTSIIGNVDLYLKLSKQAETLDELPFNDFIDKTEQYILTQNPNIPQDKKDLLKKKMDRLRALDF